MVQYKRYIIIAISSLLLIACNRDSEFENFSESETQPIKVLKEVNGSITGYVYDLNNQPVVDASVTIYSGTTRTDAQGVFSFTNAKLDQHGTYIKIKKSGFVDGSDKIFPTQGSAYSSTQLIPLDNNQSFNSNEGGSFNATNGGKVIFTPNSIANQNGDAYEGKVFVTAYFLSPNNPNIGDLMPGDLMADDELNRTVILGTAGMMAIELRDPQGKELNIKKGNTAKIELPYTDSKYPDEIDLWSFDEEKGRWQAEGQAKRKGDFYEAEVSHFSFWNCDVMYPLINLCGRVLTENGEPVRTRVEISVAGIGTSFGYTSDNGEFCGKVPQNQLLTITIRSIFCNDATLVVQKGGFDNDVILDDIIIKDFLPNVKGDVLCNNELYDNANVILSSENRTFVVTPRGKSDFDYNINALCTNLPNLKIKAFNLETNLASQEQNVDLVISGFYSLEVCVSPCDFELEMIAPCGSDLLTTNLIGGTGLYTYEWATGDSSKTIQLTSGKSKIYCVTVTETATGCTKEFCKEAVAGQINVTAFSDPCDPFLNGTINNGIPPFFIEFDNGNSVTIDITNFSAFDQNGSGVICYSITDANGCTTNGCENVGSFDPLYVDRDPSFCNGQFYNFSSSGFDYGFLSDGIGNTYNIDNFPLIVDVFKTGYSLKTATISTFQGCTQDFEIRLPFFNGLLVPSVQNTSCDSCMDGHIIVEIDPDADCLRCTYGSYKVLNVDFMDVTGQNSQESLSKGMYYLVAIDKQTDCYISHRKVTLQ